MNTANSSSPLLTVATTTVLLITFLTLQTSILFHSRKLHTQLHMKQAVKTHAKM